MTTFAATFDPSEVVTNGMVWGQCALRILLIWAVALPVAFFASHEVHDLRIDSTVRHYLCRLIRWGAIAIACVLSLEMAGWHFNVAMFATAGSVVLGFSFQTVLSNYVAGVVLLLQRPFKIGDTVRISDEEGKIKVIGLMNTHLETKDRRYVLIPNGTIVGHKVINISAAPWRRVEINFPTPRRKGTPDVDAIQKSVLAEVVDVNRYAGTKGCSPKQKGELQGSFEDEDEEEAQPAPTLALEEIDELCLRWQLRLFCRPSMYVEMKQLAGLAVVRALESIGITEGRPPLVVLQPPP